MLLFTGAWGIGMGVTHPTWSSAFWDAVSAGTGTAYYVVTQDGTQVVTQAGEDVITQAEVLYVWTQDGTQVTTQDGTWIKVQPENT